MVYTFTPQPRQFEGLGIFQPVDEQTVTLLEGADLPQITAYLQQFLAIRLRLAYRLQHQSRLAYPVNETDMRQRFKTVKPLPVHVVTEGVIRELAAWLAQLGHKQLNKGEFRQLADGGSNLELHN